MNDGRGCGGFTLAKKSGPDARQIACLRDLARWLDEEELPGVVIGGMAVMFLGRERFTKDVDALVFLEEENLDEVLSAGSKYGFQPRTKNVLKIASKSRVLLLAHTPTGVSVDMILGVLVDTLENILERRRRVPRMPQ